MEYRDAIESAFMALLADVPYEKLTIARICEEAGVTRKRFYSLYENKESLVESLFEQHAINPMKSINQTMRPGKLVSIKESINELFYDGIYERREYYTNLARSPFGLTAHFVEPVTRALCRWNDYMLSFANGSNPDEQERYVSYFFSASAAMMLQRWINEDYALSPHDMAALHHSIIEPYWETRIAVED